MLLATLQLDTNQASPKKFETKSEMLGERKVPRFSWNVVNLEQMSLSSEAAKNFLASASLLKKGLKNKHNLEQKNLVKRRNCISGAIKQLERIHLLSNLFLLHLSQAIKLGWEFYGSII